MRGKCYRCKKEKRLFYTITVEATSGKCDCPEGTPGPHKHLKLPSMTIRLCSSCGDEATPAYLLSWENRPYEQVKGQHFR